jgi:hypothetical protein
LVVLALISSTEQIVAALKESESMQSWAYIMQDPTNKVLLEL